MSKEHKTLSEEMENLRKQIVKFLVTDFYDMWIVVSISMLILWVFGIDESFEGKLITIIVAFAAALLGYILKIGTRFIPIEKYFK